MSESTVYACLACLTCITRVHTVSFPWPQAGMCAASPLMIEGDRKPNPNGLKQRENVLKFMFTSLKSRVPLARRAHISLLALLTSTLTPFEDKHCPFSVSTGGYGTSRSYLPPRSFTERKGPLPGGGVSCHSIGCTWSHDHPPNQWLWPGGGERAVCLGSGSLTLLRGLEGRRQWNPEEHSRQLPDKGPWLLGSPPPDGP